MKKSVLISICMCVASFGSLLAQGNLLITPVRVIFQDAKTREDLNITNIGNDSAVYVISFLHYIMRNDGSFNEVQKVDSNLSADNFLRIYPRRVTLAPNESQTIRLQYRKPSNLKNGEFRSHIYFRAEKNTAALGMDEPNSDSTKMAVRITPIFGISIPVIVRNGVLNHKITLSDVKITTVNDSVSNMGVKINREGGKSAYGNVVVTFHPQEGSPYEISRANGVGVYTEIAYRNFNLLLPFRNNQSKKGKLIVRFLSPVEDGNIEYARTEYFIQ